MKLIWRYGLINAMQFAGVRKHTYKRLFNEKDGVAGMFITGLLYIHLCTTTAANNYSLLQLITSIILKKTKDDREMNERSRL